MKKLLIAITGASGIPLALRFLQILGELGIERHLVVSQQSQTVLKYEHQETVDWQKCCEVKYPENDLAAPPSSGSYALDAMVVIPCSMNTLAHIAHGFESNLITRAVAVNLKQERPVVLVPRESPLSLIQIENIRQAKLAGCSIVPPILTFYFAPQTVQDMIDYVIGKILEILHIPHSLYPAWQPSQLPD